MSVLVQVVVVIAALAWVTRVARRRRFARIRRARQRARVRPGQGPREFPPAVREYIFRRDGYRCRNCGSAVDLQADHVVPYSQGGKTVPSNGQTLCGLCNRLKSNLFAE